MVILTTGQYALLLFFSGIVSATVFVYLKGALCGRRPTHGGDTGEAKEGVAGDGASGVAEGGAAGAASPGTGVYAWLEARDGVSWRDRSSLLLLCRNFLVLGAIYWYAWACEKTPLYPHGKRVEGPDYYWFFVVLFVVLGLSTLRHSGTSRVLHREQTNEWKGWMQYAFIAYHYFHAMYVYKPIRVLVSTYVWMTGFGNFLFFDKVGDYGLVRFLSVMWRLNFSCLFLLMALDTSYILYYIVPLHTMYFLMVYVVMRVRKAVSCSEWAAIGGTFVVIYIIWDMPGVFDVLFNWLNAVDGGVFVAHEWHFRTGLDHFSSLAGMAFGASMPFFVSWLGAWEAPGVSPFKSGLVKGSVIALFTAFCLGWILNYGDFVKPIYNSSHPFFVYIPIVTYILWRNATPWLRSYHVEAFAQLGQITLETYLMQHHIWLTSSAKTLLVFIPDWPLCNLLLTTVIFVLVSKTLFTITNNLRSLFIPKDSKQSLRNLGALIGTLVACLVLGSFFAKFEAPPIGVAFVGGAVGLAAGLVWLFSNHQHPYVALPQIPSPSRTTTQGAARPRPSRQPPAVVENPVKHKGLFCAAAAVLFLLVATPVCVHLSWNRLEMMEEEIRIAKKAAEESGDVIAISSQDCASHLSDGGWSAPKALSTHKADPAQEGLLPEATTIWKWSAYGMGQCGFGPKSGASIAEGARGRWLVFVGDDQAALVFRRLAATVASGMAASDNGPLVNGHKKSPAPGQSAAEFATSQVVFGSNVELEWHADSLSSMPTRLSFWWAPRVSDLATLAAAEFPGQAAGSCDSGRAKPHVLSIGLGTWDAADRTPVSEAQTSLETAVSKLSDSSLCPGTASALEGGTAGSTPVVWLAAVHPVLSRAAGHSVIDAPGWKEGAGIPDPSSVDAINRVFRSISAVTAVADLYKISEPREADTPDGSHYSDRVYNVGLQMVSNYALGPATKLRCSTCKPTITAVPGDPVLGLAAGLVIVCVTAVFILLHYYVMPKAASATVLP